MVGMFSHADSGLRVTKLQWRRIHVQARQQSRGSMKALLCLATAVPNRAVVGWHRRRTVLRALGCQSSSHFILPNALVPSQHGLRRVRLTVKD